MEPFLLIVIFTDSTAVYDTYTHTVTHGRVSIRFVFSLYIET